jgi:4-hydroxy-tetrahydrodipicolinate reductase
MVTAIKVVVAGPDGRMGQVMTHGLPSEQGIEVIGGLRRDDDLPGVLDGAHVLLDFTVADSATKLMLAAIEHGVRPVSGTSGLDDASLEQIDQAARAAGLPAIWASQFTLAGALMMHFSQIAARHMETATVVEAHHATKADAPSGTAWELAKQIRRAHGSDLADHPSKHETVSSVRGGLEGGVRIHSIRMPGLLGWNEVTFGAGGELFTMRQTDVTREAFVPFVANAIREAARTERVGLIRGYGAVIGLDV